MVKQQFGFRELLRCFLLLLAVCLLLRRLDPRIWCQMIDRWNTPHWKGVVSKAARDNRLTMVEGDIAKHTGGSITFAMHGARLTKAKNGVPPSAVELFDHTHKRRSSTESSSGCGSRGEYVTSRCSRVADTYSNNLTEKYGEDPSAYPLVDTDLWNEAVGGSKKGRLFGFGYNEDPNLVLTGTSSQANSSGSPNIDSHLVNNLQSQIEEMRTRDEIRQKEVEDLIRVNEIRQKEVEELLRREEIRNREDEIRKKEHADLMDMMKRFTQSQQFPPTPPQ